MHGQGDDLRRVRNLRRVASSSRSISRGHRKYELVGDEPCAGENGSDDSDNVDPQFTVTLIGTDGSEIDEIVGPELD